MSNNNLLISGTCGCPGVATGRVIVWTQDAPSVIKNGDIIVATDYSVDVPVWAIQMASGIVSCAHTSYSHLVSAAMFLNKPCIVGAKFSTPPTNFTIALIDAYQGVFCLCEQDSENQLCISSSEKDWRGAITGAIDEFLDSNNNKTLAHIVTLDNLQKFASFIDGIFLDATIFQKQLHEISRLTDSIVDMVAQYPATQVHYRFSQNPANGNEQICQELDFIRELRERGVDVALFFPNATSYHDIRLFRTSISATFADPTIKLGAMIESYPILDDLEAIAKDRLLDFAIVGINDFMSSCLELERDDPMNQPSFLLDTPKVKQGLSKILTVFNSSGIPCYIGYPKYNRFLEDIKILTSIGYKNFFGTPSLFDLYKNTKATN